MRACSTIQPCIPDNARIPCDECNRHFRNATCFENHKRLKISKKPVCEAKKRCRKRDVISKKIHECYKRFCSVFEEVGL